MLLPVTIGLTKLAGNKGDTDRECALRRSPTKCSVKQKVSRQQDAQMLTDDPLFVLLVKHCYGKPVLAEASRRDFLNFGGISCEPCAYTKTTLEARKRTGKAFIVALWSGTVMGFPLATNGHLVFYIAIHLLTLYHDVNRRGPLKLTTAYGFGGSSMASIDRVGGGIYPQTTAVGTSAVGKFIKPILKDHLRHSVFIADNVGDNVGGIASTCRSYAIPSGAALIVTSITSRGVNYALINPLLNCSLAQRIGAIGATGVLNEVVRLAPNLLDPYHVLGLVYNAFADKKTATGCYMIAAFLSPKDSALWKSLVT
ncbi:hypothetical protein Nepgr_004099 [Nepenthes gracilis]|uniref:H(+)-exporting diphosphatase n=1 Tax=Nepenthes gracilis TaxID=150966 RepID=A0AAD3S0P8_NEPGR|nr:hypothetical protein Nepgr_004099 [Nepenthes gracilis]